MDGRIKKTSALECITVSDDENNIEELEKIIIQSSCLCIASCNYATVKGILEVTEPDCAIVCFDQDFERFVTTIDTIRKTLFVDGHHILLIAVGLFESKQKEILKKHGVVTAVSSVRDHDVISDALKKVGQIRDILFGQSDENEAALYKFNHIRTDGVFGIRRKIMSFAEEHFGRVHNVK